jgi:hypothetical protein
VIPSLGEGIKRWMLADDRAGSKVEVPQLVKGDKPNAKQPADERLS